MNRLFPVKRFDHLEFYVGNAQQAAQFYSRCFGFTNTAYQGLETGNREVASYVMEQGEIRFVLSAALHPHHRIADSVQKHGDGVAVIALEVPDVVRAYQETTARGATGAIPPTKMGDAWGTLRYAAIHAYGDVVIKFVDRADYAGVFAPGFVPRTIEMHPLSRKVQNQPGLKAIDHVVGNVEFGQMDRWAEFFASIMDFNLLMQFDDKTISTEYSALMSKVMQDASGKIKFPINEPASGKRKSQIEEYLKYNHGAGVQHIALATDNIIETVTILKQLGVEFLSVPETYYNHLDPWVETIGEPIEKLAALGILIDRDEAGYLLQIFTRPVQDRPTLFFEIIQRQGSQGFGEGNFKALFEAIEREQALRGNL